VTRPRGRRPGDPEATRQAILDAAREEFAAAGFDGATIRAIAERAEVDPALVHHHFGSKEDLFVTVLRFPFSPTTLMAEVVASEEDGTFGERFARAYLSTVLPSPDVEGLLRSATTNDTARQMLRGFMQRTVFDAYEGYLEGADARLRMALAAAQMLGVLFLRRMVGLDALVDADVEEIVRQVGPVLDLYLGPVDTE
jgi:AcrR family transcriptional regulator